MTREEIITKVKNSLRVSTTDADIADEIGDLVDECLEKLTRSVGSGCDLDDPLIIKACKAYAGANYSGNTIEERDAWERRFRIINAELGSFGGYMEDTCA